MWHHDALDLYAHVIRYVGALAQCASLQGFTTFAQVIPVLFRIEVLLCIVLIISLFDPGQFPYRISYWGWLSLVFSHA